MFLVKCDGNQSKAQFEMDVDFVSDHWFQISIGVADIWCNYYKAKMTTEVK